MDALDLLLNRRSNGRLKEPAPDAKSLQNILDAALRVPDHAGLTPWRFIVCTGEGLDRLGSLFQEAARYHEMSQADIERASSLPTRAPMVIIAIMTYSEHPKVPRVEQIASAACTVQAMQMTAVAQSFSGIWRTGVYAQSEFVKQSLGLNQDDEILGFLYLGTPVSSLPEKTGKNHDGYVEYWR
ncbi:NAD(P)H nitroreductase [Paraneptunicella aestuarii]|uniref:NAD(P)H nitroreductase n=1 Tax=Paraneptunicella aestuarii TaxID=2831148 RepID=UPI001E3CD39E|nr:NAD(P)H nitroreductase [Paraneptunicella aestuarii]UAA40447.1 NAD(P)H nitroreductase [Paraneptunicella aestuarii]